MQFDKSVDLDKLDADIKAACAKVAARFEREAEEWRARGEHEQEIRKTVTGLSPAGTLFVTATMPMAMWNSLVPEHAAFPERPGMCRIDEKEYWTALLEVWPCREAE